MKDINQLLIQTEREIKIKQNEILSKVNPEDLGKAKAEVNKGLNSMISKNNDPMVKEALTKMILK